MRKMPLLARWFAATLPATLAALSALPVLAATPTISSLSPGDIVAGSAAFTLTINGVNFTSSSTVHWGATSLSTTFLSTSQITAAIPASLIATAGSTGITVTTSDGSSSAATFTIDPASVVGNGPPPPAISSLSPASTVAGGAAFTLTIIGTNFTNGATAAWNGTPLTTTYVNATHLTTSITPSLIASAGTVAVTVAAGGSPSAGVSFTVKPPPPTISLLSPASATAGGQAFTLTVNGTNFIPGQSATSVRWNGSLLATTYVSATQITALVPAALTGLGLGGTTSTITVATSGGTSAGAPFAINPMPPTITTGQIAPNHAVAGMNSFTMTIFGTSFLGSTTVYWGTTPLATTVLKSYMLTAAVPSSLLTTAGTFPITISALGGTSAPVTYRVQPAQPTITSLSQTSVASGSPAFTLTINGTNFSSNWNHVAWGSTQITATNVSSTQIRVTIPASLIATAGQVAISVLIPYQQSSAVLFTVNPATPAVSTLTPSSITAGSAGFMMTVSGAAFTPASKANWNSAPLDTIFVSPTQLTASIPASLLVNAGAAAITVTNAAGSSATASFTINQAPPTIGSLSPPYATAGGASFTLAIGGQNFTASSTAKLGATALATTYITPTQLTAAVPAGLIAFAGTASITVTSAFGASAAAPLTISPSFRIITTALPSGTVGLGYTGFINVTGGTPGFTWSATGLPDGLSASMTSGSTLTISGTPTTAGTATVNLAVSDSASATASNPYAIAIAAAPNGAGNASLYGRYVCLAQGFTDGDGSRWASLFSFQADGLGNFTAGIFDSNGRDAGPQSGTIDGTYSIGSDNNGIASTDAIALDGLAGNQRSNWAIALANAAQPARQFRMVEADDLGARPSGQTGAADCTLAATSAFTESTLDQSSFVFALNGENPSGVFTAAAGLFSAAAPGVIASGNLDLAVGGSTSIQTSAFAGTLSSPDPATGRFKIALRPGAAFSGLTAYIVDANRMILLDNTSGDGALAGNLRRQQQSFYSAASLSGPFVLYLQGAEFANGIGSPSGYYAAISQGSGDGADNLTINRSDQNTDSLFSSVNSTSAPAALSFDPVNPGRVTLPTSNGTTFLYLFDTTSGFELGLSGNGAVDWGWLEAQTQTSFTNPALAGHYLVGQLPLMNQAFAANAGEVSVAAGGAISSSTSTSGRAFLSWDQAANLSYSWNVASPGTGSFLTTNESQPGSSCTVISSTRFVCTPQTGSQPAIQVMQQ